jgi:PPOX class probable F420-dependent enzyme
MPKLSKHELYEFLSKGKMLAKIATLRLDGSPYINPVWYEYRNGKIYIVARKRSEYVKHVINDKRVAVLIDRPEPPYTRVLILGNAKIVEGPATKGKWVEIAYSMARRYLGKERGEEYMKKTLDRPRYLIEVKPEKIISWQGTGQWHPRYIEG